ncbi:hypothetical protein KAU09_05285 [Candidatus Parcubacteria bacterium]|nr:hypothetical protein [Candidatus Parcubacteria bacterium]
MNFIVKIKWIFLTFCVFSFFVITQVKDIDIQTLLYFALAIVFAFLLMFVTWDADKIKLITKKNNNKFIIKLLPWLVCLLTAAGALHAVALFDPLPAPKICLILYKISFTVLCALIILPIIKIPSSSEGIITMNNRPIKKKRISLISLNHLDSLPREFQTYYIFRKTFDSEIVNEQQFKVKAKFSSVSFERIKNAGKIISIDEIIFSIQVKAENLVKKEIFNKPIKMLAPGYAYGIEGEITVTYLI